MGEFEEAGGEAVVGRAGVVAEHAGDEAHDGVHEDDGGDDAIREDVVADGDFVVHEMVEDALVHAFVVAAEDDEVAALCAKAGVFLRDALIHAPPARAHEDDAGLRRAERFHGLEDWLAFHHHALPAAVGRVVGGAVAVVRPVAEVVGLEGEEALFLRALHHALAECGGGDGGEEAEDVYLHGIAACENLALLVRRAEEFEFVAVLLFLPHFTLNHHVVGAVFVLHEDLERVAGVGGF